jgi:hypothetical protein
MNLVSCTLFEQLLRPPKWWQGQEHYIYPYGSCMLDTAEGNGAHPQSQMDNEDILSDPSVSLSTVLH